MVGPGIHPLDMLEREGDVVRKVLPNGLPQEMQAAKGPAPDSL